ncbi:MAG: CoB--CoM heterodisulfide reductase iron-sulfur subunit B family protein [Deltaproteobacteria bacterium]|nr:CoB--CoM heterodisulfide reductase iron-sulfur subunit B family protein [Deltaproteobacteria bacterium]
MREGRVVQPEDKIPNIPDAVFLFRSCTGSLEYPGTESAIREILSMVGIEAVMDADQTCCSGYLLTCSAYKPEVSLAATARNLAIAERHNLDTYAFCNGCYGYMRELSHLLLSRPALLESANRLIGRWGYEYTGRTHILHIQELWCRLQEIIAAKVVFPLHKLRIGVHYGCHYLAQQINILDAERYPTFHEDIVMSLGGTPVFYPERSLCCGYAVGRGFTHRVETVEPHLYRKFCSARDAGVELITTVCPGCNVALDREQPDLNARYQENFQIPVIDLSQLIALALGVPVEKLGFEANTVSLNNILKRLRRR